MASHGSASARSLRKCVRAARLFLLLTAVVCVSACGSGRLLLVGSDNTGSRNVYQLDPATGALTYRDVLPAGASGSWFWEGRAIDGSLDREYLVTEAPSGLPCSVVAIDTGSGHYLYSKQVATQNAYGCFGRVIGVDSGSGDIVAALESTQTSSTLLVNINPTTGSISPVSTIGQLGQVNSGELYTAVDWAINKIYVIDIRGTTPSSYVAKVHTLDGSTGATLSVVPVTMGPYAYVKNLVVSTSGEILCTVHTSPGPPSGREYIGTLDPASGKLQVHGAIPSLYQWWPDSYCAYNPFAKRVYTVASAAGGGDYILTIDAKTKKFVSAVPIVMGGATAASWFLIWVP